MIDVKDLFKNDYIDGTINVEYFSWIILSILPVPPLALNDNVTVDSSSQMVPD